MISKLTFTLTDWIILSCFFAFFLVIGVIKNNKAGRSASEFFASGKKMPWWLLGISMVATTFSADTPNLVTDIVRKNGVSGNWIWWNFLLTGMISAFVYARLWRRSGFTTDLAFYELRYGGKSAALLRGFRALYLGVFFNILIMASVSLAAIKIGGVMGFSPLQTLFVTTLVIVIYSSVGGLRSVIITDFFQFFMAMAGTIAAAIYILQLPEIGGLSHMLSKPAVIDRMNFFPDFSEASTLVPLFVLPLLVHWWSVWYPGAEPGGGGYIAQRMLAAKDEKNALVATLTFTIAHYAIRPWPWIIIALASLIIFPDIESLRHAFPSIPEDKIGHDLAYPAMLVLLPSGLLGIIVASLAAAYMSTISTHLNWGASYISHDFYKRFINSKASDRKLVAIGRISIIFLAIISSWIALSLNHALQAFSILLQIGAGTGLIFILRWFWWRINAYTEIVGMVVSFLMALYLDLIYPLFFTPLETHWKLVIGVGVTTVSWFAVTLLTRPEKNETLIRFYEKIKPSPFGWQAVLRKNPTLQQGTGTLTIELLFATVGIFTVYGLLFSIGYGLYGNSIYAGLTGGVALIGILFMVLNWKKLNL